MKTILKISLLVFVVNLIFCFAGAENAIGQKYIRTIPTERPDWVDNPPHSNEELVFVGVSKRFSTQTDARNQAQEDGRKQLCDYYGTSMVNEVERISGTFGLSHETFSPQIAGLEIEKRIAQNTVQALKAKSFYTEVYEENAGEAYIVYVLMVIDKGFVTKIIDNYIKEIADDLRRKAAAEKDAEMRKQIEEASKYLRNDFNSNFD